MAEGICSERAGFLFKHGCKNSALHSCERCGKEVCNLHVEMGEDGQQWCVSCSKAARKQLGPAERSSYRSSRPQYYYGDSWYPGYGHYHSGWGYHHYHSHYHDNDDFTEGDADALGDAGDEGFERDLDDS